MALTQSPFPAEHREPEHGSLDGPSPAPPRYHDRPSVRERAISRRLFVRGAAGAAALAVGPGLSSAHAAAGKELAGGGRSSAAAALAAAGRGTTAPLGGAGMAAAPPSAT